MQTNETAKQSHSIIIISVLIVVYSVVIMIITILNSVVKILLSPSSTSSLASSSRRRHRHRFSASSLNLNSSSIIICYLRFTPLMYYNNDHYFDRPFLNFYGHPDNQLLISPCQHCSIFLSMSINALQVDFYSIFFRVIHLYCIHNEGGHLDDVITAFSQKYFQSQQPFIQYMPYHSIRKCLHEK